MEKVSPWKTKSSKIKYDNPWIEVREDKVINPAGKNGIYGVVHFKNKAIGIVPLDKNNNTWLVRQFRYTLNEYSWEIPMGGGPHNINTLKSAKKELKEETGIEAKTWKKMCKIHLSNSATDEVGYIFLAQNLSFGNTNFEDTEDIKIKKLPLTESLNMISDGKITDVNSIAGLLYVNQFINSKYGR